MLKERSFPTLDLDDLPSDVVITYFDGIEQQISKQELLTRVKGYREDSREKRRRTKNHNNNIGMTMSFNAIWQTLIDEGDEKKAEAAIAKAKKKYPAEVLAGVYAERLENAGNKHQKTKVSRFLGRHGVKVES